LWPPVDEDTTTTTADEIRATPVSLAGNPAVRIADESAVGIVKPAEGVTAELR
jgi:hypothetical protein